MNKLTRLLGLRRPEGRLLRLFPLAVLSTANLWTALTLPRPFPWGLLMQLLWAAAAEELLFRGLLFGLCRPQKAAPVLTALAFGAAHLLNLLSGAAWPQTLLQAGLAVLLGLVYGLLRLETGSILPGLLSHAALNATSVFVREAWNPAAVGVQAALLGLYGLRLWKNKP